LIGLRRYNMDAQDNNTENPQAFIVVKSESGAHAFSDRFTRRNYVNGKVASLISESTCARYERTTSRLDLDTMLKKVVCSKGAISGKLDTLSNSMHRLRLPIQSLLLMVVGLFSPTASFAQAVDFANDRPFLTQADRLVRDVSSAPLVGTNYVAQLYYGPEGTPAGSLVPVTSSPAQFRPPTTMKPGTWLGGYRTLQGMAIGQVATLQVRVWDNTVGATWEEALATGFGQTQYGTSALFSYEVPLTGPPPLWYIENFRGFTLVPEPSILALGLSGAFIVVLLRRRK
jgi:hypothetical protein